MIKHCVHLKQRGYYSTDYEKIQWDQIKTHKGSTSSILCKYNARSMKLMQHANFKILNKD